jgi:type II secretory pathway component GspD/PulD (secretin)
MKRILIAMVLGGIALQQTVRSQTNLAATNQPAPAAVAANAPTAAPAVSNMTPVTAVTPVSAAVSNQTTAANAATPPASANTASATNAPADPTASIPLISFQDVPLTTAIENLARQAGINYLLDPRIGYGQPDQSGQVKAEPTLSIRWENITAEQALVALLDNYGLQMVPDKKTHIARITIKDPSAPIPLTTRVIQLKYSSVSNMVTAVQSVLTDKRSRVLADVRTSQLIVVGTDPEQSAVDTLLAELDKPTRQVLIESRLVEITSSPSSKKGIDWTSTLSAQNITYGNGSLGSSTTTTTLPGSTTTTTGSGGGTSTTSTGSSTTTILNTIPGAGFAVNTASGLTPNIGFLSASGLNVVLSFLNSSEDAQIISTPRIVTLDNEMAQLSVVRGYPVFNVSAGSANNAGGSTVNYTNVGTILQVTPRITANDYIWLHVIPEVSSFFGNFSQSVVTGGTGVGSTATLTAPVFDFRTFETQVLIPNANTLVMGGLVNDNPATTTTKVPFMGDIPVLGYAFRSEAKSLDKDNLLIFITPTIVKDTDFAPDADASRFLKSDRHAKHEVLFDDKSSWNSTKSDWSDLFHGQPAPADAQP